MSSTRKHPLAKCEECPLQDRPFVPSWGNKYANVVLVGEAPGRTEVYTKMPFTGMSGQLLDKINPVKRREVYFTNTCLCRPVDNATPSTKAISACNERLIEEIKAVDPDSVMTLGATATKALLGPKTKIAVERLGPPKRSNKLPGIDIIPTYRPAAALYNSNLLPDIVHDFNKHLGEKGKPWVPPNYFIIDDPEDLSKLSDLFMSKAAIALDIEIDVDKDTNDVDPSRYPIKCIGIGRGDWVAIIVGDAIYDPYLVRFLSSKNIIAHNGKFDLNGIRAAIGHRFNLWFDTMLASYALDERPGSNSLRQIAIETLDSPDWKKVIDDFGGYGKVPDQELYKYNAYDVANTYRLFRALSGQLIDQGLMELHDFMVKCSNTLMDVEFNGVLIDEPYIDELETDLMYQMKEIHDKLRDLVDLNDYNPNSWQQVKYVLSERFGEYVPNTQAQTITDLMLKSDGEVFDFCENHLKFKKLSKLNSTYVKGMKKKIRNGRVTTSYRIHGTDTGRLASRNPNLQNIPRDSSIRKMFIGEEGNQIVQMDYKQAELRAVAWLAQDEYLREVFTAGRDIHSEVAANLFGPQFTKEDRVKAKGVVFGLTYGMTSIGLSAMFRMEQREAQRYIDGWFEMIPSTVEWIKSVHEQALTEQELQSPFGHKRRFPLITRMNKEEILKKATAFLPQNIASNICLLGANNIHDNGYGDRIRLLVHDAVILELPKESKHLGLIKDLMEIAGRSIFGTYIDTPVDVAIGRSWGELH